MIKAPLNPMYIDGKLMVFTPTINNGDMPWGIEVDIPEGSKEITLLVKDDESLIGDRLGHGNWLNAGFLASTSNRK